MTGHESKRAAAQDKVTDIDGHVVRDVRKPKKVAALDRDAEIERLNEKIEFLARTNMLYSDWEHRNTQVTSDLMRKGIEAAKLNADLRAEIAKLKAQLAPQPAQKPNRAWTCNECGAQEFTAALSEADLNYLACSNCGGDEFHKEALAQPVQDMEFAGIEIWVGNARIAKYLTQTELHYARDPWMLMQYSAEMCISKLKEKNT